MIKLEFFDCSELKNIKTTNLANKFMVQGEDYCKMYDKLKNVSIVMTNDKLEIETNIDVLKKKLLNYDSNKKFKKLFNYFLEYEEKKNKILFLEQLKQKSFKIKKYELFLEHIEKYENIIKSQNISFQNLNFIDPNKLNVNTSNNKFNILVNPDKSINVVHQNSNHDNYIKKNFIGGIIFANYNKIISNNYMIVSNINDIDNLKNNKNKKIIIFHPTNDLLKKISNIVQNNKYDDFIWIILPTNIQIKHCGFDIDDLACFLFKDHLNPILNKINVDTMFDTLQNNKINISFEIEDESMKKLVKIENKIEIVVEKIKYKLSDVEKSICPEITNENIKMINKIFMYNLDKLDKSYKSNKLKKIQNNEILECPICCVDLISNPILQSYTICGHLFCSHCMLKIIGSKQNCPNCRNNLNFSDINIPNLILTKFKILIKLIRKLIKQKNTSNILIYVDNYTLSKHLTKYINNLNNLDVKCENLNEKSEYLNNSNNLIICPINKENMVKNIKNIENIIIFTTEDYSLKYESLGYNYFNNINGVKIWLFDLFFGNPTKM